MPIIIEQSNVRQMSRFGAIAQVLYQLEKCDYADVALDIQIRIDGDVRTITVRRGLPEDITERTLWDWPK